ISPAAGSTHAALLTIFAPQVRRDQWCFSRIRGYAAAMTENRFTEAADLLGVSDDTLRRWQQQGRVSTTTTSGVTAVPGPELAPLELELGDGTDRGSLTGTACIRLRGVVMKVTKDTRMAQVEKACGTYRVVALISREADDNLALEP